MCECQQISTEMNSQLLVPPSFSMLPWSMKEDAADRLLWLAGREIQGMGTLIASASPFDRPNSRTQCNNKLADMIAHLRSDRAAGFKGGKGAIRRQNDMLEDARGLFRDRFKNTGTESWKGHADVLQLLLDALQAALDAWNGSNCTCEQLYKGNPNGLRDCKLRLAEARIVLRVGVPSQPANYQAQQEQQIPQWLRDAGAGIVDGVLMVPKVVWFLFEGAILIIAAILGIEARSYG